MCAPTAGLSAKSTRAPWSLQPATVVFALCFITRAAFVVVKYKIGLFRGSFFTADSVDYDALAQSILNGKGFSINGEYTALYSPLYPIFLALCYWVFGRNFLLVGIVQSALSALSSVFSFKISARVFDERIAWLAGLACAVMPDLIFWTSGSIATESLYTVFLTGSVFFLVELLPGAGSSYSRKPISRSDVRTALLTGIFLASSSLTRPIAFYFALCALLYLLRYAGAARAVLVGLVFLMFVLPWAYRNERTMGSPIFTTTIGGIALYHVHNEFTTGENGGYNAVLVRLPEADSLPEVERDRFYKRAVVTFARQHLLREVALTFARFRNMWRPTIARAPWPYHVIAALTYIPMMLFAIGAVLQLRFRNPRIGILCLFLLFHFIFHLLTIGEIRYRVPLEPILIIYGAVGMDQCLRRAHAWSLPGMFRRQPRILTTFHRN